MITVVLGFVVVALLAFLVMSNSERQVEDSYRVYREDRVLASTEAQLERFAALLTEDGLYYTSQVDEAERARICTASSITANIGTVREPGQPWSDLNCTAWDYQDPVAGWYVSPIIPAANVGEQVELLMEVSPPAGANPLSVLVVGRNPVATEMRTVSAEMRAESLSEYVRSSNGDLRYGAGADITGKIFANGDLDFTAGNTVHSDIFARGRIGQRSGYTTPIYLDGAVAYAGSTVGGQNPPPYNDFFDTPLATFDFNNIWQQTQAVKTAACLGGGLCLDNPSANSYLIEPIVNGSGGAFRIWWNATSMNPGSCGNVFNDDGHLDSGWNSMGTIPIPANGAVWADGDVIVGNRDIGGNTAFLEGAFTIYAGDDNNPIPGLPTSGNQFIMVNKSILVNERDGSEPGGTAVAALIASGEAYLRKEAGQASGNHLTLEASLLTQGGIFRGTTCGASSSTTEFTFKGSLTSQGTGSMSGTFTPRNYGFDARLAHIRPPFFPLINDQWWWQNWRELQPPAWAS